MKLRQSVSFSLIIHILHGSACLLSNNIWLPARFTAPDESILRSTNFSVEQVSNIIKKLDPSKTHGYGKISMQIFTLLTQTISNHFHKLF